MKKKHRMVRVEWDDSATLTGWVARSATASTAACTSIGYVVERTPEKLVLAGDTSPEENGRLIAIPASVIRSVKRLR